MKVIGTGAVQGFAEGDVTDLPKKEAKKLLDAGAAVELPSLAASDKTVEDIARGVIRGDVFEDTAELATAALFIGAGDRPERGINPYAALAPDIADQAVPNLLADEPVIRECIDGAGPA